MISALSKKWGCAPQRALPVVNTGCAPQRILSLNSSANTNPKGIQLLWLELTQACNLACRHCYCDASPIGGIARWMKVDHAIRSLKKYAERGCNTVQFTGGEPTLYPYLKEVIVESTKLGYRQREVFTNGTCLDSRLLDFFAFHQISMAFSVYGENSSIHDAVTQIPGSFHITTHHIQEALNAGIKVRCAIILNDSYRQEPLTINTYLEEMGVPDISFHSVKSVGRGKKVTVTADQFFCEDEDCMMLNKRCVSWDGQVYPCVFSRKEPLTDEY